MNHLNSILIEGNLVYNPIKDGDKVVFSVKFSRYFQIDGNKSEEVGTVIIETYKSVASIVLKSLSKGLGVRVVGRIKDIGDGKIIVIGENVEIKPKFDK